jgi:hypothetical protein
MARSRLFELLIVASLGAFGPALAGVWWVYDSNRAIKDLAQSVQDREAMLEVVVKEFRSTQADNTSPDRIYLFRRQCPSPLAKVGEVSVNLATPAPPSKTLETVLVCQPPVPAAK